MNKLSQKLKVKSAETPRRRKAQGNARQESQKLRSLSGLLTFNRLESKISNPSSLAIIYSIERLDRVADSVAWQSSVGSITNGV